MVAPTGLTLLQDVKGFKSSWRIQVKVLRMWKQYSPGYGESLEVVLADENGSKIHATVRKSQIKRVSNALRVSFWHIIDTFNLNPNTGKYKISNLNYRMSFTNNTVIGRSDLKLDDHFLNLANFRDVKSNEYDENILIDVLGQIVSLGNIEMVNANNRMTKKLEFELRDAEDERIGCTMWASYADQVKEACENLKANEKIIILIRFAKIHSFQGELTFTNGFDASEILINPLCYPEVEEFKSLLPNDDLSLIVANSNETDAVAVRKKTNFLDYPKKVIDDILTEPEIGKWRVLATVNAIDTDWGWFYFACKDCNNKVELVRDINGDNRVSRNPKKPKFWCETCVTTVTNAVARYKLHVRIVDDSGEIKVMLFDSYAAKVIGKSCAELLNGSFDEIEDPSIVPNAISNLHGKTFLFVVSVEKHNIHCGSAYYKIAKVWLGSDLSKEESEIEFDNAYDPSSAIDMDQGPLLLTNSMEQSDATTSSFSTPLTKRSGCSMLDLSEHSSSTKKICLAGIECNESENQSGEEKQKESDEVSNEKVLIDDDKESGVKVSGVNNTNQNSVKVKKERYKE